MYIKRETEYAIHALLALQNEDGYTDASLVAKKRKLPPSLLAKVYQKLARAGIVESKLGPDGGFRLKRKFSQINMLEVFEAMQGSEVITCFNGTAPHCLAKCPIRKVVINLESTIKNYLQSVTLDNVLGGVNIEE